MLEPASLITSEGLQLEQAGERLPERILLHCCCAPCAEWPLYFLRLHGVEPEGFFYNPNIHPKPEWQRRLDGMAELSELKDFSYHFADDFEEELWRNFPTKKKSDHCRICYSKRLNRTAEEAARLGYAGFTTALLVSPYQDRDLILSLGELAARRFGVSFYGFDFRPGYEKGQEMAKADGIYRQRFCGCIYSLGESSFKEKIARQLELSPEDIPERAV